jgi:outer membrane protein assembly factor BamC
MNRPNLALVLKLSVLLALGGCSGAQQVLSGKPIDYKTAGSLPPLEIPPDLTSPTRDDRFTVPGTGRSSATLSAYQAERAQPGVPVQTSVLPSIEKYRVERAGTQRWLVVPEPPEKLWPMVKDFWQETGFLIRVEQPEAGVMETDWAENRAKLPQDFIRETLGKLLDQVYSTSERDKFRTRLERSADGGTEVYISHRGMTEVFTGRGVGDTGWQPRPSDPDLEAEFLRRLMVRLGVQEERAKQVMANRPTEQRAQLSKGLDGFDALELLEPFDRAWRRVGLALDRVGFTVEDRNRQQGLYFVRYADPEADMDRKNAERPGLLSRLAFWRNSDPKVKAEQYRVVVKQDNDNSQVRVLDKDGTAVKTQTAQRILSLLHEQLR